jgi:hypothetical protein
MHTPSFAGYMERIERGDWQGVGEMMLASAQILARAGANFLICPDNTIHQALPLIEERSPLPWLHIAEVVAATAPSAASGGWRLRERAGWSRAKFIRRNCGTRDPLCAPTPKSAKRSTASLWKS